MEKYQINPDHIEWQDVDVGLYVHGDGKMQLWVKRDMDGNLSVVWIKIDRVLVVDPDECCAFLGYTYRDKWFHRDAVT